MDSPASTDLHPLVAYREAQKPPMSQEQLADKLGVDRSTICRWERGRKISDEYLGAVSRTLNIPRRVLRPDLAALLDEAAE